MRNLLVVLLLAFMPAVSSSATPSPSPASPVPWTHVRGVTDTAKQLIAEAVTRSDIVEGLVQSLETTDVVVYVSDKDGIAGRRDEPSAWLGIVSCAAGTRYLLVRVGRWMTPPWVRIAELGHELQHAVEVASAPEVRDEVGLARLYRRIGWETDRGHFESDAAVAVGKRVLSQQLGFEPR